MMDEEVAWLKREAGNTGEAAEAAEADEGGSGSGGRTPDHQPVSSNVPPAQPMSHGERVDTRTVAPPNGNGDGVGTGDLRANERNIMDLGLREQRLSSPSRADHYRLSHMANVALGAETGEQHQHSQNAILRGTSAPRD